MERVEILADGASAVYGSDAIGGVVNIILRKDFEGGEIMTFATDPDRPGGEERGVSVTSGFSGDRGRVTWAFEANHKGIVKSADRPFLANQFLGGDPNRYENWSQTSAYARNIKDVVTGVERPMIVGAVGETGCEIYGAGFLPQIMNSQFSPHTHCRYDYTKVAAETAQLDRLSGFMTAEYDISSDLAFHAQMLAARVESFGRYAPAAAPFFWMGPDLPEETIG